MTLRQTDIIEPGENVMDSRDIIARIEALEEFEQAAKNEAVEIKARIEGMEGEGPDSEAAMKIWTAADGTEYAETVDWTEDEYGELKRLRDLAEEASGSPDWTYGETLIRDSYFEDYARELAEGCGMVKDDVTWPNNCIDWEKAADMLKQDYMSVDFGDETYWIRA